MRIIHEIDGEPSTTVSAQPYAKRADAVKSTGFRVNALVLVEERGLTPGEELHIEGNARHVLKALRELIEQIEGIAEIYVDDGTIDEGWEKVER